MPLAAVIKMVKYVDEELVDIYWKCLSARWQIHPTSYKEGILSLISFCTPYLDVGCVGHETHCIRAIFLRGLLQCSENIQCSANIHHWHVKKSCPNITNVRIKNFDKNYTRLINLVI